MLLKICADAKLTAPMSVRTVSWSWKASTKAPIRSDKSPNAPSPRI